MTQENERHLAGHAFNLGVMVAMHLQSRGQGSLNRAFNERLWDTVRQIAQGKMTMMSSPSELTTRYPDLNPEFREEVFSVTNEVLRREREVARLVWEDFEESS